MKLKQIVYVEWIDSHASDGCMWTDVESIKHWDLSVISYGLLLEETDDTISLAHSFSADAILGVIKIPKVAITKIVRHKLKKVQ